MNFRSEKGVTGIDITVSIIIITLFIGIIATLMFNINSSSGGIGRKSEATNYAITEIEKIKAQDFNTLNNKEESGYIEDTPYYKTIKIQDYKYLNNSNINDEKIQEDILKKLTVEISYKTGKNIETVSLSTIIKGY